MAWVAVAVVGGSIAGGLISANGAKSAANTQANAAMNAAQISQQQYQQTAAQEAPFLQSGYGAQSQLNYLLGIGPIPGQGVSNGPGQASGQPQGAPGTATTNLRGAQPQGFGASNWANAMNGPGYSGNARLTGGPSVDPTFTPNTGGTGPISNVVNPQQTPQPNPNYTGGYNLPPASGSTAGGFGSLLSPFTADTFKQYSPAYQFQLQQGQQGVLNGASSSAGALSGSAQKDLMDYNQNAANTAFNTAFNQYQTQQGNIYSRLAGVANSGQNAASNTGAQGTALAGQAAQSVSNAGSAIAAGQVGAANAYSGAINNAVPWLASMGSAQPAAGWLGGGAAGGF